MIVVIGAGPTGLATAYHLQKYDLPYRVLEKHAIGYAWRNHYDRLHLNSLKELSALPGMPMPETYPAFPSASQFVAYLEDYARHFSLNIETGVEVQEAAYIDEHWHLKTNRGPVDADILVVATGIWSTPHIPTFGGETHFRGQIIHSRVYRNAAPFQGQRVLVVGVGNSGSEIAVDLGEHGVDVGISIREGAYFIEKASSPEETRAWIDRMHSLPRQEAEAEMHKAVKTFESLGIPNPDISPLDRGAVVGFALPEAVKAGQVKVYPCVEVFTEDGVRFLDGREVPFDTVIMATGFRPTVRFVAEENLEFDSKGKLCLSDTCRSTRNPRLYCVGFTYPTTEGFLHSLHHVTRDVVEEIAGSYHHPCEGGK